MWLNGNEEEWLPTAWVPDQPPSHPVDYSNRPEIFALILRHIPPRDLLTCERVSKNRNAAIRTDAVWRVHGALVCEPNMLEAAYEVVNREKEEWEGFESDDSWRGTLWRWLCKSVHFATNIRLRHQVNTASKPWRREPARRPPCTRRTCRPPRSPNCPPSGAIGALTANGTMMCDADLT